jgi:PadR family transcriptional regulator PadR
MLKRHCKSKHWKYNDIVSTVILILLNRKPDHGYNIIHTVSDILGYSPTLNGMIYRLLTFFETNGLARSEWKIEETSQPKKVYTITERGRSVLRDRIAVLRSQINRLKEILILYEGGAQ